MSGECLSCVFVIKLCNFGNFKNFSKLLLAHSIFAGHELGDFPGGTGYSHGAPAIWPGATIIWTAGIKQLRKWHNFSILTIIWSKNHIKPHTLWGKYILTDLFCLCTCAINCVCRNILADKDKLKTITLCEMCRMLSTDLMTWPDDSTAKLIQQRCKVK